MRDDKDPKEVGLEATSVQRKSERNGTISKREAHLSVAARANTATKPPPRKIARRTLSSEGGTPGRIDKGSLLDQLSAIEKKGGDGSLDLGGGEALEAISPLYETTLVSWLEERLS